MQDNIQDSSDDRSSIASNLWYNLPGGEVPHHAKHMALTYFLSSIKKAAAFADEHITVTEDYGKTAAGIKLPPTGSYQAILKDINTNTHIDDNSLFIILQLLTLISKSQTAVQKAGTIAEARMAVETAISQILSADFTLHSELASAESTKLEGTAQIISGICNIVVGFATAVLSVLPGVELAKAAATDATTPVAGDVSAAESAATKALPAAENSALAEAKVVKMTAQQDTELENLADASESDQAESDEEIEVAATQLSETPTPSEKVAAENPISSIEGEAEVDEAKGKLAQSATKTEKVEGPSVWTRFMAAGKQRENVINSVSSILNGLSSLSSGTIKQLEYAQQVIAAAQKGESSLSSVRQQLTQELYQAFGQLVSDITDKISKTLQAMEQERRSTTDSRIMGA